MTCDWVQLCNSCKERPKVSPSKCSRFGWCWGRSGPWCTSVEFSARPMWLFFVYLINNLHDIESKFPCFYSAPKLLDAIPLHQTECNASTVGCTTTGLMILAGSFEVARFASGDQSQLMFFKSTALHNHPTVSVDWAQGTPDVARRLECLTKSCGYLHMVATRLQAL